MNDREMEVPTLVPPPDEFAKDEATNPRLSTLPPGTAEELRELGSRVEEIRMAVANAGEVFLKLDRTLALVYLAVQAIEGRIIVQDERFEDVERRLTTLESRLPPEPQAAE